MKIVKQLSLAPPRFRNREDALLFMECLEKGTPFPKEKWVHPFVKTPEGCVKYSQEYVDAPFEQALIYA